MKQKKKKRKKNIKQSFKQEISNAVVRRYCSRKKNFETHSSRTVEKSINSNVALLDTDSDGSLVVPMIFIYEKTVRERSTGRGTTSSDRKYNAKPLKIIVPLIFRKLKMGCIGREGWGKRQSWPLTR